MLLVARRLASLIYFVSAGAARYRPKAHDPPGARGERRSLASTAIGFSSTGLAGVHEVGYLKTDVRIFQVPPTKVYTIAR
jgi:hypothetical protein